MNSYVQQIDDRAKRKQQRLSEIIGRYNQITAPPPHVEKCFRELCCMMDQAIREEHRSALEADSLMVELSKYRPVRDDEPAAPVLDGYVYVHTATFPWVCASVEVVEFVSIPGPAGVLGYRQEHSTWEEKTVCGKKAFYPVNERHTSGGWPRLRELCPECTRRLWAMPKQRELFPAILEKEVVACGI